MKRRKFSQHMLVHYLLAAGSFVAVLFLTKSPLFATLAFLINIFLDADHLFDYWLANGFNLNFKEFVRQTLGVGHYCKKLGKVFVPFHSWEVLLLVLITARVINLPQLVIASIFGFLPHLIWDQITFAKRSLMYSFIFRALRKFDLEYFCKVW